MDIFSFFRKPPLPPAYRWYEEACADASLLKKPLREARFVVLDTETTGLNPRKDGLLSIAAVEVQNYTLKISSIFEAEVQQAHFNNESIAIHGITPGRAAVAEPEKEVLHEFLHYIRGDVLIGHHIAFDYEMLSKAYKQSLGFSLLNKRYDTTQLLRRTDTHFAHDTLHQDHEWGLDSLCERYQIPLPDRHTALGDATATALLFMKLLKRLEKRGARTVRDLLKRRR